MSIQTVFALVVVAQIVVSGALLLIQPFVARRGLLFGVYVGEDRWASAEARSITRRWVVEMCAAMPASIALGGLVLALHVGPPVVGPVTAVVAHILASYAVYLHAYVSARRLAVPGQPAVAAAVLTGHIAHGTQLPVASLVIASICGVLAVGFALMHYGELPATIPVHFGFAGHPDAWSARTLRTVMMLPVTSLLLPVAVAVMSCMVAHAKRAIRREDGGVSFEAQMRFRRGMSSFLAGTAILISLMLSGLSVTVIRTSLGWTTGLPWWLMMLGIVIVIYAIGGSLYLALRYGQGGSRLERGVATQPLTNGLADNSRWVLGSFYVNRDDPSFFVEKRFGVGYTINFGNPKAVALLVAFLVIVAAVTISGVLTPQTHTAPVR